MPGFGAASIPFGNHCKGSGNKLAQVYFVSGMPWAITDSQELVDNIDTNLRRKLFGVNARGVPAAYPADDVVIIPTLDPNTGDQTIQYTQKKGLTVGGWKVRFDSDNIGSNFSDYYDGDCYGLLGLDVRPRLVDPDIKIAELDSEYPIPGTTGSAKIRDVAGFAAWVTAGIAGGNYVIAWIGQHAIAIDGIAGPTNEVYTLTFKTCFRSKQEFLFPTDSNDRVVQIYSAPVTGIVGRAAYHFLIELKDNGTLQEDFSTGGDDVYPIIYRQGQVQANPDKDGSTWTINHTGFTSWLNVDVPNPVVRGGLRGFCLSRQRSAGQKPHIIMREEDGALSNATKELWLCDEGEVIYFDTKQDLLDAVMSELEDTSQHSDIGVNPVNLAYEYRQISGDIQFSGTTAQWVTMGGIVPFILGIGYVRDLHTRQIEIEYKSGWPRDLCPWEYPYSTFDSGSTTDPDDSDGTAHSSVLLYNYNQDMITDDSTFFDSSTGTYKAGFENQAPTKNTYNCHYFWQWDWTQGDRTVPSLSEQIALNQQPGKYKCGFIPLPDLDSPSSPPDLGNRFFINTESDVNTFTDGVEINIGSLDNTTKVRVPAGRPTTIMAGSPRPLMLKGTIDTSGVDPDYGASGEGLDFISFDAGSNWGGHLEIITETVAAPVMYGTSLYFMDGVHDFDPWPISDQRENEFDTPGKMIRALLGEGGLGMRKSGQVSHIPDVVEESDDDRALIDFTELDDLIQSIYSDTTYRIKYPDTTGSSGGGSKRIKLNDLINNMLLTHGLRAVWEYREAQRSWVMGFAKISFANLTEAQLSGRTLNETNIISAPPKHKDAEHKLMQSLSWTGDINGQIYTISPELGIKQHVAAASPIKIEDIGASYTDIDAIFETLLGLYQIMALPSPVQKFAVRPSALAMVAVGREVSMSWRALINSVTGKRDTRTNNTVGLVEKAIISLDKIGLSIQLDERAIVGIAPAMEFSHTNASLSGDVISLTGLITAATNNVFANPNIHTNFTDLAYFDCYYHDKGTNEVLLNADCGCGNYRVTVIKRNDRVLTDSGAGREVWTGTISAVDISAGTATITLDNSTNFDDSANDYILEYASYNDASLTACQKNWAYWGDQDGLVTDGGGTAKRAVTLI
jgi:hypothetical protein